MPSKPVKLYILKDIDYNAVIAEYRKLCREGISHYDDRDFSVYESKPSSVIVDKEPREPLKDDTRIRNKAVFLMHTIIYRQQTSKENEQEGGTLQAHVLQSILGKDYFEILKAFENLGYVERTSTYVIGKSSKRHIAKGETGTEPCTNMTIIKYILHSKELLDEEITKRLTSSRFKQEYGDGFAETYIKNLNKFKIKNLKDFKVFASDRIKNNPDTEAYYDFIQESFKSKLKIYSIDSNNRIYHILTSLKRELKQYINIRYSIDCSNSHPLLFNYFIYLNKKIPIKNSFSISYILSLISSSTISSTSSGIFHYDIQYLRNALIDNGVEKSKLARLEDDELLYLWKTTTGVFWDDILAAHQEEGFDRAEIKRKMFGEVFYSKTPKIAWKTFAKEFKEQYPNVYELILRWKEPQYYESMKKVLLRHNKAVVINGMTLIDNTETALPNLMMDLESTIFREILKSLFRKRICCVHIHDAIVVPDVKSTEKVEANKIQEVMRDVYKGFGLHPTFKVERYDGNAPTIPAEASS